MTERAAVLAELRARLQAGDRRRQPGRKKPVALGLPVVDRALPWNGFARGGLHELIGTPSDAARFGFLAALLARLPAGDGRILWCRGGLCARDAGRPYGPGLAALGVAPARLLLFTAKRPDDVLWALEEGLRCRRLAAVIGEGIDLDMTASRRLQLAAEAGDTLGLILPASPHPPLTAVLSRWRITSAPAAPARIHCARWQVSLLRCRGGGDGTWLIEREEDDTALRLAVAADLADRPLAAE